MVSGLFILLLTINQCHPAPIAVVTLCYQTIEWALHGLNMLIIDKRGLFTHRHITFLTCFTWKSFNSYYRTYTEQLLKSGSLPHYGRETCGGSRERALTLPRAGKENVAMATTSTQRCFHTQQGMICMHHISDPGMNRRWCFRHYGNNLLLVQHRQLKTDSLMESIKSFSFNSYKKVIFHF